MSQENPYRPPESAVSDPAGHLRAGATVAGGLAGEYRLEMGEVLGEAWRLTRGMKGSFWGAALVVGLIAIIVSVVLNFAGLLWAGSMEALESSIVMQFGMQVAINAVMAPFGAGLIMIGVRRAAGLPVSFDTAFAYLGLFLPLAVLMVLQSILTGIGYLLLILPGIYLAVAYTLALPLAADRRFGSWQALETSRRAITRHWFQVFVLLLVSWLILLLGILSVIGWIWAGPLLVNVHGILYREIFGVHEAGADGEEATVEGGMQA
ncbi:MAG TPA: hypothetical protein ENN42_06535 [Thioalkalivibrio sp.]|nr:hypothetical protein [Thioalkalivibrio sp.]